MSEPTYRIEIEHKPTDPLNKYSAHVERITDDEYLFSGYGATANEAVTDAREKIRQYATIEPKRQPIYTDEHGNLTAAPEPQSLKA